MYFFVRRVSQIVLILLVMMFVNNFSGAAFASEEQLEFNSLNVAVWPEYDDPRVLVILEGTFVNTSDKPFNGLVKWNIPKDSNLEVGMACEIVNGGSHSCQPYKVEDKGEWKELSWRTTRTIAPGEVYPVFLEYYYNPINGTTDKTFDFAFQPSYNIQSLNVSVQQPLKAANFKIDPAAVSSNRDSAGFTNHDYSYSSQTPEDKLTYKVSYTKSDSSPSVQKQDNNSSAASGTVGGGEAGSGSKGWIPMLFAVLAVGALIGYFMSQAKVRKPARVKVDRKPGSQSRQKTGSGSGLAEEKKRLKQQLAEGLITEETYEEMLNTMK